MQTSAAFSSLLLIVALQLSGMNTLKICSYNIPQFNKDKSSNHRAMNIMTRILTQCDISLVLGVQDVAAVNTLLPALNSESSRYSEKYKYKSVLSKPLGPNPKNQEIYTFIYRTQTVNVTGQHQYQSSGFVRPPFVVRFQSNKASIKEFVLIPLHSEPSKTVLEMDSLYEVFLEVLHKWKIEHVMLLGDFHAGCAYMSRAQKKQIRLSSNTSFSWLISDRMDTTLTEETHCPYDRIVVFGKTFLKHIKPFSAKVFNPVQHLKVRSTELVGLSEHLPIMVDLKASATSLLHGSLCFLTLMLHFLITL